MAMPVQTRRWLRGRILELAREASDGSWVVYDDAIGQHPAGAVRESVLAMAGVAALVGRGDEQITTAPTTTARKRMTFRPRWELRVCADIA